MVGGLHVRGRWGRGGYRGRRENEILDPFNDDTVSHQTCAFNDSCNILGCACIISGMVSEKAVLTRRDTVLVFYASSCTEQRQDSPEPELHLSAVLELDTQAQTICDNCVKWNNFRLLVMVLSRKQYSNIENPDSCDRLSLVRFRLKGHEGWTGKCNDFAIDTAYYEYYSQFRA